MKRYRRRSPAGEPGAGPRRADAGGSRGSRYNASNLLETVEEIDGYQHIESFGRFVTTMLAWLRRERSSSSLSTHRRDTIQSFVDQTVRHPASGIRILQTTLSSSGLFEAAGIDGARAGSLVEAGYDLRRTVSTTLVPTEVLVESTGPLTRP